MEIGRLQQQQIKQAAQINNNKNTYTYVSPPSEKPAPKPDSSTNSAKQHVNQIVADVKTNKQKLKKPY